MDNFTFRADTQYVFGRDTEQQTGELCARYGATKVLIVYGGGSAVRSGLMGRVEASLADRGLVYGELGGVKPNPDDELVREGIGRVRREGFDFLLAVGGGSVIDTAKAIAAGACYEGDFWDFYVGKATVRRALPVGTVLTIPAAGSEGSGNTVITDRATRQKVSLRCPDHLRPRFSVLNPVLTYTLPPAQTAAGVCDMMVHIFERYFSNTPHTAVTDRLCEGLLMAIMEEAPKVMAQPDDYEARANIMWAGTMAHNGVCGTGREEDWASHFMEHELSALYGVTHGAGLAVIFPAFLKVVAPLRPHRVVQLSERVLGVEAGGRSEADIMAEGIARLQAFWSSLGLPATLAGLGIEKPDIDALVAAVHRTKGEPIGNYVKLDRTLTRRIYEAAR